MRVVVPDGEAEHGDELGDDGVEVTGDEGDLAQLQPWWSAAPNCGGRFSTNAANASRQSADAVMCTWCSVSRATKSANAHRLGGDVVRLQAAAGERSRRGEAGDAAAHLVAERVVVEHVVDEPDRAASSAVELARQQRQLAGRPAPTSRGSVHGRPMSPATATSRKAVLSCAERAA